MINKNDIVIFIKSHKRAKTIKLPKTDLEYYIIIDNLDTEKDLYIEKYKEKIVIFSKDEYYEKIDTASLKSFGMGTQVFAFNFCIDYAKKINKKYFLLLDDDYTGYYYIYKDKYKAKHINISNYFDLFVIKTFELLEKTKNVTAYAWAQGGDYIGGEFSRTALRKIMNVIFCSTERHFNFLGLNNEDTTTFTKLGNQGYIFITLQNPVVIQQKTQKQAGGYTEIYKKYGTYFKSFFSVLYLPSAIKISVMGDKNMRIHHKIKWDLAVPKIISDIYKNKRGKR